MENINLVDTNFEPLRKEELEKAHAVYDDVINKQKEGRLLVTYRGSNFDSFQEKMRGDNLPDSEVFNHAFYFGDKARHFNIDLVEGRDWLRNISDCSERSIEVLFDLVARVVNTEGIQHAISDEFKAYFTNSDNRTHFIGGFRRSRWNNFNATPSPRDILLRDYYLFLLHGAGDDHDGVVRETFFVSTSVDKAVALNFSGGHRPVVFHYCIPASFHRYAVAPWLIAKHVDLAISRKMPTYNPRGLFGNESEVSVKGALFPHFIFGIEFPRDEILVVNPYLFDTPTKQFAKHGCIINQQNFRARLAEETRILRGGVVDDQGNYEQA